MIAQPRIRSQDPSILTTNSASVAGYTHRRRIGTCMGDILVGYGDRLA